VPQQFTDAFKAGRGRRFGIHCQPKPKTVTEPAMRALNLETVSSEMDNPPHVVCHEESTVTYRSGTVPALLKLQFVDQSALISANDLPA